MVAGVSTGGDATEDILAKMARSRAEIRGLLEPPPSPDANSGADGEEAGSGVFPRSRTMRMLMSGRGIGTVAAVVGGLVMARPALAWRLIRLLPSGAVARLLLVKAITALRSKRG